MGTYYNQKRKKSSLEFSRSPSISIHLTQGRGPDYRGGDGYRGRDPRDRGGRGPPFPGGGYPPDDGFYPRGGHRGGESLIVFAGFLFAMSSMR